MLSNFRLPHINLRSRGTTATTKSTTTEAGSKLARSSFLIVTASVATFTRARTRTTFALFTTEHTARGSVRTLLLDVGGRNNLSRQVEPFTQVVKTL